MYTLLQWRYSLYYPLKYLFILHFTLKSKVHLKLTTVYTVSGSKSSVQLMKSNLLKWLWFSHFSVVPPLPLIKYLYMFGPVLNSLFCTLGWFCAPITHYFNFSSFQISVDIWKSYSYFSLLTRLHWPCLAIWMLI